MKQKFIISGMTCSACSSHVENSVKKLQGVQNVSVNLLTNSMTAEFNEHAISPNDIIHAVEKAGYGAKLLTENSAQEISQTQTKNAQPQHKDIFRRLTISFVFVILLMYVSMGHMIGLPIPFKNDALSNSFLQFLLCLPVVYLNKHYYINGFKRLFNAKPNMDSLIAVGSSASLLYGIVAIFVLSSATISGDSEALELFKNNVYFDSAAMILTLVTLGKFLEDKSKKRTTEALNKLKNLAPNSAILLVDGVELEVDSKTLKKGDIVVVKSGMTLPADGKIISGQCYVDQSAINGESMPVEKFAGDSVIGGTINTNGYVQVQVTEVGVDSILSKIISLVEDANATKPPISKLADKIAGVFVPIVMSISLVTLVVWLLSAQSFNFALSCAISVLVISCPCALGLATPLAVMVATGKGAEQGILVKSGEALQTLHSINTVVLDKTGTITHGKPQVCDIFCDIDQTQFMQLVASVENLSEHPLSTAIVSFAKQKDIEFLPTENFKATFGQGVSAVVKGQLVEIGNKTFFKNSNIDISNLTQNLETLSQQGKTPLLVAIDGKSAGIVAVADTLKPSSFEAVEMLKKMKIDVVMLTGDNQKTADAIANQVGISKVFAEVLPHQKDQVVQSLMQQGKKVAMIGDGINDAPSLARADVGISVGRGSDIAIDSADVILMSDKLTDAATAIALSKTTIKNILQNLFWAFFYNACCIPIAAGVLFPFFGITLNPMMGAAAMSLSSLFVAANALRLKFFKHPPKTQQNSNKSQTDQQTAVSNANTYLEFPQIETNENSPKPQQSKPKGEQNMKNIIFKIQGMMCGHCKAMVEKTLTAEKGVVSVSVDLAEKTATVEATQDADAKSMAQAVETAGYKVLSIEQN